MKELTKVAIRIFALFFLTRLAFHVTGIVYMIGDNQSHARLIDWIYYILVMALYVGIAIFLWGYNDMLANLIISNKSGEDIMIGHNYEELMSIALKIFGLILIIFSFEPTLRACKNILDVIRIEYELKINAFHLIALLDPIIKILIGTVLVLRKRKTQESMPDLSGQ